MSNPPYPDDLREAWAYVLAYAWQKNNADFLTQLRRDPKQTVTNVVNSGNPEPILGPCATILEYVNREGSVEGFLMLPNLPDGLQDLSEEQLFAYANQDGMFGLMRIS